MVVPELHRGYLHVLGARNPLPSPPCICIHIIYTHTQAFICRVVSTLHLLGHPTMSFGHLMNQTCAPVLHGAAGILTPSLNASPTSGQGNASAIPRVPSLSGPKALRDIAEPVCPGDFGIRTHHGPTVPRGSPRCPDIALTICRVGRQALTLQKCCLPWPDTSKSYLAEWGPPVQQGDDLTTLDVKPALLLILSSTPGLFFFIPPLPEK